MKNRIPLFVILVVVSIASAAAVPASKKEVVYFTPHIDDITIETGQVGVLRMAFVNCSYGLSFDWINGTSQHYLVSTGDKEIASITDDMNHKRRDWSEPFIVSYDYEGKPVEEHCAFPAENVWRIDWTHKDLRFDKPGIYQIDVFIETTQTMIDGFALLSSLDVYEPHVWFDKTITVTVLQ